MTRTSNHSKTSTQQQETPQSFNNERDIPFGKPYRDRKVSSYKWTGDRVSLQIGEGYIRYSSLPILQAVAGFLESGDAPSQEKALDAL